MHPGQRVEHVFAYLHEVDVVLIDAKPRGWQGQMRVSKSVLGVAMSRSSAWLDTAAL
jgi:pentose-5-phosphate-3-epimerase